MKTSHKSREAWEARVESDPAFAAQVADKFAAPVAPWKADTEQSREAASELKRMVAEYYEDGHQS